MKKRYFVLFLICFTCLGVSAQTLDQARSMYEKGEYEQAKPIFKKYVKSQPANGNYNLWYGVCCLKTNEPEEAVKYLEVAVKKRISGGQLYLGQSYNKVYRFDEAIQCYEEYISDLTKRKRPTEEAEKLLEKSKANLRMLKGVEEVCFIDSFVVDKSRFLEAYKISQESGKLFMFNDFFKTEGEHNGTVYETELENKIYYSELQSDGTMGILSSNKLQGEWAKATLLPGNINQGVNANYPYVLTDGLTIYYAADGESSMGGYDIFVTRYNTNTNSYLTPENVGMPFNSAFNDYMYVIDEFSNLGWFASDRFQPEGKVCIYVFIPNASKQVYNYESIDPHKAILLAQIHSIKATWTDKKEVEEALDRLKKVGTKQKPDKRVYDFEFVIDDNITYYQNSDFKSPQAKALFNKYRQLEKDYEQQQSKLEDQRTSYAHANDAEKTKLAPGILDLEKRVYQLGDEVEKLAIEVRNIEKQTLK